MSQIADHRRQMIPKGWKKSIKLGMINAISLARYVAGRARGEAVEQRPELVPSQECDRRPAASLVGTLFEPKLSLGERSVTAGRTAVAGFEFFVVAARRERPTTKLADADERRWPAGLSSSVRQEKGSRRQPFRPAVRCAKMKSSAWRTKTCTESPCETSIAACC